MSNRWTLSPDLQALISKRLSESGPAGMGTDFYPSILWSLGGEIRRGNSTEKVDPHYAMGWIKRSDLGRFASVKHEEFGFVAFQPSPGDGTIGDGIIDLGDNGIYVRATSP